MISSIISRENKVIAAAFVLFVAAFGIGAALGLEGPVFGVLVLVAIPILGPQFYLAATGDDEVAPETRIRISVLISLVLLGPTGVTGTGRERTVVRAILLVLFGGLLAYEFYSGYRSRAADR